MPTHLFPDHSTLSIVHVVHLIKDDPLNVSHDIRTLRNRKEGLVMQPRSSIKMSQRQHGTLAYHVQHDIKGVAAPAWDIL